MVARAKMLPARRPVVRRVVAAGMAIGGGVAVVFGAPLSAILLVLGIASTFLIAAASHRHARVLRRLASLPFPIEHDRNGPFDANFVYASAIRSVTVRFVNRLDRLVLERIACDAQLRAPELALATDGDTMTISAWPWGADDLLLLLDLLRTWAHPLHAEHPIAAVRVTWAPSGPPGTL
jgi:hypothetical protein